ncbi:MAG: crotonase [Actinobacteria bacterium]|nr:crotonase [Actinomycetota bacterium]
MDDDTGTTARLTTESTSQRARVMVEHRGPATWLRIAERDQDNRLSRATLDTLHDELVTSASDDYCRVIVLTGRDRVFCPGGMIDGLSDGVIASQEAFAASFLRLLGTIDTLEVPVIAAINGPCHAAGMSLLHTSDLAVAVDTATFGYPEIKAGLFPMLAMAAAEHALPRKLLFDLWYSGRLLGAPEALELGLLNEVVSEDELDARIDGIAVELAGRSPIALAHGRRAYHAIRRMTPDAAARHSGSALLALLAHSVGEDSPWAGTAAESRPGPTGQEVSG